MEHIRSNYPDVPKIVIFCPTLNASSQLNKLLHFKLRKNQIGPHIVDMFNRACSIAKRTEIVKSFCERDGAVRIVIASTSFGMGVDCPNIRKIIHWGPPENLDTYMQETGRAGRDGLQAHACLLYGHARGFVSQAMKDYGQNSSICRRTLLCESFLFSDVSSYVKPKKCECCDLCFSICQCDQCIKI